MTAQQGGTEKSGMVLGECLTVAHAVAIKQQLLEHLEATAGDVTLDLSAVEEVDVAGLQLLWATHLSCQVQGRRLQVVHGRGAFAAALRTAGLHDVAAGETGWDLEEEGADG